MMGDADLDCHGQGHFHPMNNLKILLHTTLS